MPTERLTQLDAVNLMLAGAGEKPINSIESPSGQLARAALSELQRTFRQTQSERWWFNYDEEITLPMEATTGFVYVPANVTRFDVPDDKYVIQRGGRLFDRRGQTFVFDTAQTGNALYLLEWDEVPEEARAYAAAMAARKLYESHVGSQEGVRSLYLEERTARARLLERDCEQGDYNILNNPDMPRFTPRQTGY